MRTTFHDEPVERQDVELADEVAVGIGFATLGVALFGYGLRRKMNVVTFGAT